MKKIGTICMLTAVAVLAVLSYGFIDPNFPASQHPFSAMLREALMFLVYRRPWITAGIYAGAIGLFFTGFMVCVREARGVRIKRIPGWFLAVVAIALLSFPAFSYDIFNYIATAKLTFFYGENPYIVMPIEISNEPMLAFTRAANKLALYGPVWIMLSAFPHLLGAGNIIATIFSFKLFAGFFYAAVSYMIYRKTKRWDQTLFFAANPLVLIEVLVNGHNDITMMALALSGLLLWQKDALIHRAAALVLFAASLFVKGATVALIPLFFLKLTWEKKMIAGFVLMFGVFLVSPLREEMYPWYAVWWLVFASLIPMGRKLLFIHGFSVWMSLGLMLRYIPWIGTREYGGMTPLVRIILMILPVFLYLVWYSYPIFRKRYRGLRKRV